MLFKKYALLTSFPSKIPSGGAKGNTPAFKKDAKYFNFNVR